MILKVKNENGEFKEVVLKGLKGERGERGERGEDGTVLQQKEIDDIKSSLDKKTIQLNTKIDEVATTGTTLEAVQNKVSEMAEQGLIQAYTLGDRTVGKEKLNSDIFLKDSLLIKNIKLNSTSKNRFLRNFWLKIDNNTKNIAITGKLNQDLTKSNYCPQIIIGIYNVVDKNTQGNTPLDTQIIAINSNEFNINYSFDITNLNNYIRVGITFYTQTYDDLDKIEITEFAIKKDGVIANIENIGVGASDVATYDYSLLMTGLEELVSKNYVLNEFEKREKGVNRYVSNANELMLALEEANIYATSDKWYNIYLEKGVYNLLTYIDLDRITSVTATGYRGIEVPNYTKLIGDINRGSIIEVNLPSTATTEQMWTVSPLNLKNSAHLYNLVVKGKNVRYACHDDGGNMSFDRYVENCEFVHYQNEGSIGWKQQDAYGMGTYKGSTITFKDCDFRAYGYGFYLHDNPNYNLPSTVRIENCRFESGLQRPDNSIKFQGMGASAMTNVTMKNCSINKEILIENTSTISMEVKKYNTNIES